MAANVESLSQADLKTLEQTRHRLYQLTNGLNSLRNQLLSSENLPQPSSIQSQLNIISTNLSSLSTHLSTAHPTLSSLAVYPSPSVFPGREPEKEGVLGQLLRKKLEPRVEDWLEKTRSIAQVDDKTAPPNTRLETPQMKELWEWAGPTANQLAREREWGDEFTKEEREGGIENAVTGLQKSLDESEEDESEEDEEGDRPMGDAEETTEVKDELGRRPPVPLNEMLRFLSTGAQPRVSWPL